MSTPTYLEVNISQIQNLDISGNTTISGSVRADSSYNVVSDLSSTRIQLQNAANSQYIHMSLAGLSFTGTLTPQSATVLRGVNAASSPYTLSQTELGYLAGVNNPIQQQFADLSANTQTALNLRAPLANPTFTGTVSGITKTMVGLGNVDNTSDANKPVSTATQTALDAKAPLANPTFTGTVSGITNTMVGLGNVDNTSDANKPVSTATQTALNAKANDNAVVHLEGAETITGDKTFTGNVIANAKTVSPTQLGYLSDLSLSLLDAFNSRPVYGQLLAANNTWTGVNTFSTNNVVVSKSIAIGSTVVETDNSIYFPSTMVNRKIVLYRGFNNEFQNYSIGVQASTMQFMVFTTGDGFTFSGGSSSTTKADFARIDNTGVNILSGNLLLGNTNLFARNNTWTGINTFSTNHLYVSRSIGIGNATIQDNSGVYFPPQALNRKVVLYPVSNNEFQNISIGATATSMQFMLDNAGDTYVFSAATSSTAKTDYATLNNNGLNITNSIGIAGASIQATGGIYFPNTDNNRQVVLYTGNISSPNAFQNHSIGKGAFTMQFLVDTTSNRYTFSAATSASTKTDFALIGNTGVDIKMGSLLISGSDIFTRNNTWSGTTTFSGSITANAVTVTPTQLGYLSDLSLSLIANFNARPVYSQLLAASQTWSGTNTFAGSIVANAKTITPTQFGYLSDLSLSLLDAFNARPVYGQILAATQTWSGINTFSDNLSATKSLSIGGGTIQENSGVYFPPEPLNRKLVLYPVANNEFQNISIGATASSMQFMLDNNTTSSFAFSAATSSTAKTDFVSINNTGLNIVSGNLLLGGTNILARTNTWSGTNTFSTQLVLSAGLLATGTLTADQMKITNSASVQSGGGFYFPATNINRKIVLFPVTSGECGNHSIGVNTSGTNFQFMIPDINRRYLFSYGTGASTKTDIATLSSGGFNIQSGSLLIGGTAYDTNLVHLTGTETITGNKTFTGTVSGITTAMVGLGNVDNTSDADKPVSLATQTALDAKAPLDNPTFTGTVSGITASMVGLGNVDNTSDANKPVSSATQTALNAKAPLANPTFTGTVSGITKAMVGLGNVDNTSDANKPVSSATQTALNAKANDNAVVHLTGNETIAGNKTFTGTIAGITATMVGLGNVDNTSDINKPVSTATQTALDAKAPLANPIFTGTVSGITKAMVGLGNVDNTSDANKPVSSATQTALDAKANDNAVVHLTGNETIAGNKTFTGTIAGITATMVGLGNVDNTSDINKPVSIATQTALDAKAPLANPIFTGTVSGITKTMVGLGNVDNTSDANKPVSTATQTALDAKANDNAVVHLTGNETIAGNKTFTGTIAGITATMVGLGNVNNTSDANKPVSTATQTALDAKAPLANPTFTGTVSGITATMVGLGNVNNTSDANKPVSTATQTALDAKAPLANPTFTGTVSGITATMVGLGNVNNTSDANKPVSTATQTALDAKANDNAVVHLTGDETIAGNKTFNNLGIGKTATTNVLDVSGNVNYDMTSGSITIQNGQFTDFTGFTIPTSNNKTTLVTNLTGTFSLGNWRWSGNGTNIVHWLRGDNTLVYWSSSPPNSTYFIFNTSYSGNAFSFQHTFNSLDAGNYILTFYSYWGGSAGSLTASLKISVNNSSNTLVYSDPETRTTNQWKLRTFFFTVTATGSNYIRWTPSDTATAGTAFYWAIGNVSLIKYEGIKITDTTGNKVSYLGGALSSLNNPTLTDAIAYNTLSLSGIANFNASGNNTNCLVINSDFSKAVNAANKLCVVLGLSVSPYATTYNQCIHIGSSIQHNAANPQTICNGTIILGTNVQGGYQNDIMIGYNLNKSRDTTGENIMIGTNIGYQAGVAQGVGCGRRSIAIGSSIFGAYNGFGLNPTQPLEAVAIGYNSQSVCFDNYNTSVGCYSLQNIIGNAKNTGSGQTTAYLTQYNAALGYQAGSGQSLMNNCTYVGALARSTVNDISNSTVLGHGSTVGASFATAVGSGVVNNIANSVRLGRSIDSVRIDGSMVLIGDLFTNTNRITQAQLGYLSDFTTTSIKQYVDNNSAAGMLATNNNWTGTNIFPSLQTQSGSTIDGSSNVYMKLGYFADSSNTTFSLKGSGSTVPTSVSGFALTNTGTVTMFNSPARGNVFNFSGSNYLNTSTSPITNANCSLSFWVYYTGTNQNNRAVISSLWWPIYYDNNKMTTQLYYTGNPLTLVETATRPENSWVHYTYVVDNTASVLSLYVNGVFDVSGTNASTFGASNWGRIPSFPNYPFVVGGYNGGASSPKTSLYLGYLDDVRVFSRSLTQEEVYSVYLNNTYAPVCYYKSITTNNRAQLAWDFYNSSDTFLDIQYRGSSRVQATNNGLNIPTGTVSLGGTDIFARSNTWSGINTFSSLDLNKGMTIDGSANVLSKMSYDISNEFALDLTSSTIPASYEAYTITNTGSVTTFSDATRGNVLSFNGSNKLSIPSPVKKSAECTMSFWVYYTGQNNQMVLSSTWWPIFYESNKIKTTVYYTGNPSVSVQETTVKTVNSWNHYAIVVDYFGGRVLLYTNGVLDVSASSPSTFTSSTWGAITNNNTNLFIGNTDATINSPYNNGLVGYLDDVRVYNEALSGSDVQRVIYNRAPSATANVPMVYQKRDRYGRLVWDFYGDEECYLDIQYKGSSKTRISSRGIDICGNVILGGTNMLVRTNNSNQLRISNSIYSATNYWYLGMESTGTLVLYNSQQNTGVFLAWGGTSWSANSDREIKKNIVSISSALDKVAQLNPVYYNYIMDSSNSRVKIGFVAQEVQQLFPEAICEGSYSNDLNRYILGITVTDLIPFLTKAIQEVNQKTIEHANKIEVIDASIRQVVDVSGNANINGDLVLSQKIRPFKSPNSVINADMSLCFPLHHWYSVCAKTAPFTVILPTITENELGCEVNFRRVSGGVGEEHTIYFMCETANQKVYNTQLLGGDTPQPLMDGGTYIVKLVALVDGETDNFAWFQV